MKLLKRTIEQDRGVCIGVILHETTGDLLLVRNTGRRKPTGQLPGGIIAIGESRDQALIRKVHEHTGLQLEFKRTTFLFSTSAKNKKYYYHVYVSLVQDFHGLRKEPTPYAGGVLESVVVNAEQIVDFPMMPQHRSLLNIAVKNICEMCATS